MSSHRTPSSDRTQTKDLDDGDKENIIRVPSPESVKSELAADPELNVIPSPNAQRDECVTGFKLFNIITAVALVTFLMLLDTSIVSTAIPRITSEFHSLADVGWYGSSYQLACAAIQPLTGRVYMNLSTKWTFVGFFFVFELGSLICAISTSSKMLIVGRAVAGIGGSGILNGAFTIVSGCVPMSRRPTMIGLVMGVSQVGLVAGPLVGGALTEYTTWRWCFYINLPIGGLVAIMLTFVKIPEVLPKQKFITAIRGLPGQLDLIGFALFAPSAIQLLLALQYGGNKFTWHSTQVIGLFCGAGATFIAFLLWGYRQGDKAMIPFAMIRKTIVWSSCLSYGLLMAQVFCVLWYLPQYFQGVKNDRPLMSGVHLLPSILAHLFGAVLSGKIIERVGYYLPIIIISTSLTTVSNGLLSMLSPHTSTGKWIGYQILLGLSRSLGLQIPIIAVQHVLPPSQIPIATALVMFSQTFAGALFLSFSDTIFTNSLSTLIPIYCPSVDPHTIINAGATEFRSYVSQLELPEVLLAYAKSVDRLVRMRLIVEKNRTRRASLNDTSEAVGPAEDEAALFLDVKVEILNSSPRDVLLLHLYSNELEIAVSSLSFTPSDVKASRQHHLFQALTSINSWFDILFMIPPAGYISFPFAIFSQVSRCLLSLYRLAILDAPNWDKNHVQQIANPLSILNRLVDTLEQVPAVVGIDNSNYPNGDFFSRSAQMLRSFRPEWQAQLSSDDMVSIEPYPHDVNGIHMPDASFFGDDSMYDDWFMELMSSTF